MKKPLLTYSDCPYYLDEKIRNNLIEISDNNGSPFLLMPEHIVKKKKMGHRIIFVLLKDKKNRVLLVKKHSEKNKVLWEFPCYGIVYAGESAMGTAYKELKKHFYIETINIKEITTLPYLHNDIYVSASIFLAAPFTGIFQYNPETITDAMFVDKEEFNGLLNYDSEAFDPIITWANRANWLYS